MKDRTFDPQRQEALNKANEVRSARATLKDQIKRGEVTAAEIILSPPDVVSSWPVGQLLMSQRRWGSQRCRRFLASVEIKEMKKIGELTDRQRGVLAAALSGLSGQLAGHRVPDLSGHRVPELSGRRTPELQYA